MKNKQRVISKYLTQIFETSNEQAEWFGYYNYDTLNHDHSKMLCNRSQTESDRADRESGHIIELGYYELKNGEWHKIGETDSWNWQQGAMMQWMPGASNESKVIYNCSKNGHITSRIHNIETGEDKDIDWAIYGITPDGNKSIALDFERSYWCRAYHYQSVANPEKEGRVAKSDGIFEIDLQKNTRRLLIDINKIVCLDPDDDFDKKKHWVEHIMINPSGTRFCFLHRFSPIDNVLQYKTRVCIANIDGTGLQVIPNWNNMMWSHFGWRGDTDFAIYSYRRPQLYKAFDVKESSKKQSKRIDIKKVFRNIALGIKKKIPRSLIHQFIANNSFYQFYTVNSEGRYVLGDEWVKPYFDVDGHPSFTSDGKYMLTDSYPDQDNCRRYIVFNTENKKGLIIAKMPENSKSGNAACDLHPKLSQDNQFVAFDTTSAGKHSMILFRINWEEIKKAIS